jgi:porin
LNYDFAYTNYGANFLNSSFGISPEVSVNVPTFSTYPFNAFGIRADYQMGDYFVRGAIVSGNPGNHVSNKYSFNYNFNENDGLFYIAELEKEKMFGEDIFLSNYRIGAWYHTGKFNYLTDTTGSLTHKGDFGAYIMGEKLVFSETADKTQGLGVFANAGFTPGDYNFISAYIGGGLCYTGLIPKRNSDILSLGIANPILNSSLKKVDKTYTSIEEAIELNYNYIISDNFNIMPCIQYLPNPGFHNNNNNPLIFMVRMSFRNGMLYNNR